MSRTSHFSRAAVKSIRGLPLYVHPKQRLYVECPECGAKPGHPCISLRSAAYEDGGYPRPVARFHKGRTVNRGGSCT